MNTTSTRTLLLTTSFPPTLGGIETLLYQTARHLASPPMVVAPVPAHTSDVPVWKVRTVPAGLAGRVGYQLAWRLHPSLHYLAKFWRPASAAAAAWRPKVLQCGHVYLAPTTSLLARRLRLPWLVYAHGQEVWRGGRRVGLAGPDSWLRGGMLREADTVLVQGTFTRGLVQEWGVDARRIQIVPFGASPPLTPSDSAPEGKTLLSIGRLVPRKGIDTMLRALPRVADVHPDVTYRIVGEGPDRARLERLATDLRLNARVRFLGRISREALEAELDGCALFALPARVTEDGQREGYGLVYFEAAARGRAVLAGRSGGEIDAVVDGVTGLTVDGHSVEDVALALVELLGNPERLRAMGQAGWRRVKETHNWERAAMSVDQVVERLHQGERL